MNDASPALPDNPVDAASVRTAVDAFLTPRRVEASAAEVALLAAAETGQAMLDGQRLRWWRWGGRGPVALLVHGWDSRASHLGGFVAPLRAAGWRVLAFDALAHGDSGGAASSVVHHARSLEAVVAATGGVDAVIAHSVGSAAALIAFRRGLQVRASVHLAGPSSLRRVARAVAGAAGVPAPAVPAFLAEVERRAGLPMDEVGLPAVAQGLSHPGLLVHDPADAEVPFDHSDRLAAHWPAATVWRVEGLGHRRLLRDAEVVARAVAFIGTAPPTA